MPEDPKGYRGSTDFQTKDLGETMSTFEIREDGTLWKEAVEYEYEEGNPKAKNWIDRLPTSKRISSSWNQEIFTDTIVMYDYINSKKGPYDYIIDYEVVFIKGIVSSVKILDFEAQDNFQRKVNEKRFEKEMEEWNKFQQTRQYKYFVKPYRIVINFIFRKLHRFLDYIKNNLWRVERLLKG